jgi:bifunctional DNase/RNase
MEGSTEVEVEVERIIFCESALQQIVVLHEINGQRRLSLITGYFEAMALWWTLKREPNPRPITHQAWISTIVALGAEAQSVCVLTRHEDTYFAELRLRSAGSLVKVDIRPSDALTIAMRAGVPFRFREGLLQAYGVSEPECHGF